MRKGEAADEMKIIDEESSQISKHTLHLQSSSTPLWECQVVLLNIYLSSDMLL